MICSEPQRLTPIGGSPSPEIDLSDTAPSTAKILEASFQKKRRSYLYVNNRLEGCAPLTIEGLLTRLTTPPVSTST